MNAIPYMEMPEVEEVLSYVKRDKFPCPKETEEIIQTEIAAGNTILVAIDAGCMPDETVVMIKFEKPASREYPGTKTITLEDGRVYKRVYLPDKYHGVMEFRFGRENKSGTTDGALVVGHDMVSPRQSTV